MPRLLELPRFARRIAAASLLAVLASPLIAQDVPQVGGGAQSEPTLPPVEVRPPAAPDVPITPAPEEDVTAPPVTPGGSPFDPSATSIDGAGTSPTSPPPFTGTSPITANPTLGSQVLGGGLLEGAGLDSMFRSEQSLFSIPAAATIVDRATLDERLSSTVYRSLQNEVGVTLQQTGNGQLSPFIRGLTGQQILIMIDGIRMNNTVLRPGPNQYAATVDPGMVQQIEVVRGPQSALWGSDAIGGAINIVTRSADPLRGDYSQFGMQQIMGSADWSMYTRPNFEMWSGSTGIIGGASYLNVNEIDRGGDFGRQPGTDYSQFAGDIRIDRVLSDTMIATVALQHFEQFDVPRSDRFLPFVLGPPSNGVIPTQRPTFFDQQRDLAYVRLQGIAPVENPLYDGYSFTVSYSLTKERNDENRYSSNAPNATRTRLTTGQFRDDVVGTSLAAAKDHGRLGIFRYGMDYYYEDIDAWRLRTNNPDNPGATPTVEDPQYPDDSRADRVGAYLNWEVPLSDRLSANYGLRYENVDLSSTPNYSGIGLFSFDRTYQDWISSIGLAYSVTPELKLVGGVYEGFRAPTIDDLTGNKTALQNVQSLPRIGDLGIQPEHSRTYEVGFKHDGERIRFQVFEWWNDFHSVLGREVVNVNGQDFDFLANQSAYLNGTEAYGEYLLDPSWALYGNFAYTYGINTVTDEFFSRIPPTQGILGLRWRDVRRTSYFDIYTWMVQRQDRYNPSNLGDVRFPAGGTPGYATLNVRAGTQLGRSGNHRVSLSLENLTDKYYRVLGSGVDGAGFNAVVGYEWFR